MESEHVQFPDPLCVLFKSMPAFVESPPAAFIKNVTGVLTLAGPFPGGPNSKEQKRRPKVTFGAAQMSAGSRALSTPRVMWQWTADIPLTGELGTHCCGTNNFIFKQQRERS